MQKTTEDNRGTAAWIQDDCGDLNPTLESLGRYSPPSEGSLKSLQGQEAVSSFSSAYNATQKRYPSVIHNVGNDDICVSQVILIPLDIFCLYNLMNT